MAEFLWQDGEDQAEKTGAVESDNGPSNSCGGMPVEVPG
jgi:hypothetical protein